jgi:hypothetical protein
MDAMQIWQSIVLPFAAAGFGGWIAAQFALSRFRNERTWERRADAYSEIFGALHRAGEWFSQHQDALERGEKIPEERSQRMNKQYAEARVKMRRRIAAETWVLRADLEQRIDLLEDTLNSRLFTSFDEMLDKGSAAVEAAINDLRQIARKDLKLVGPTWISKRLHKPRRLDRYSCIE